MNGVSFGVGHLDSRFGLASSFKNQGLFFTFSPFDLRFPHTFSLENGSLLFALGGQDGCASVTLSTHLLFHGLLDVHWRSDVFQFNPIYFHPPLISGVIHYLKEFRVNLVTGSQTLIQGQLAHHITQAGFAQLFNGVRQVGDLINRCLYVRDLEIEHGINFNSYIIPGDHVLLGEIKNLFAKINCRLRGSYDVFHTTDIHLFIAPLHGSWTVHDWDDNI